MKAIWSGSISFGLIYIPVRLYSASRSARPKFHLLHKTDLCPVGYQRVCRTTGEEVPYEEIVKGYEYQKGDFVILTDEDFELANARKTRTVEILHFADESEVDPKYFEKPYYLEPVPEAGKIYGLLREAMRRTRRVGIAKFVLRTQEHLAALRAEENLLVLNQMRFKAEVLDSSGLNLPGTVDLSGKEMEMAVSLIEQLTEPFQPEKYQDTYTNELMSVIERKIEGKAPIPKEKPPRPTEVPDLMAKLRQSLEQARARRTAQAG